MRPAASLGPRAAVPVPPSGRVAALQEALPALPLPVALVDLATGRVVAHSAVLASVLGRPEDRLAEVWPAAAGGGPDVLAALGAALVPDRRGQVVHQDGEHPSRWWHHDVVHVEGDLALVHVAEATDDRALVAELQALLDHDDLTGLWARTRFRRGVDDALREPTTVVGLVMLDVDRFKAINDRHGHAAGDRALVGLAARLGDALRAGEAAGRLSGDELACLIVGEDRAEVERRCRDLADGVASLEGVPYGRLTTSAGWAVRGPGAPGRDVDELLAAADVALIRAKARRRPARRQPRAEHAAMAAIAALDDLDPDGFSLWVQPIVETTTGDVVAGEVLIRGRDRSGRVVAPKHFVAAAEAAGLALDLDTWVVGELARTVASGQTALTRFTTNVSLASLDEPDAADQLLAAAVGGGLRPSQVVLEVTETSPPHDLEGIADRLRRLRDAGFAVAIDDLGSGFADLRRLRLLPHDVIKLDAEMVAAVATDPLDLAMVESCLRIAAVHRRPVVAEGVDSEACLATLRRLRVPYVQGFHTGRPHPLAGSPLVTAPQAPLWAVRARRG